MRSWARRAAIPLMLGLAILGWGPRVLAHGNPEVSVNPSQATAGGTITISGQGFEEYDNLTVTLEGAQGSTRVASARTDGEGAFSVTVTLASGLVAGSYQVKAAGSEGGASAGLEMVAPAGAAAPAPAAAETPASPAQTADSDADASLTTPASVSPISASADTALAGPCDAAWEAEFRYIHHRNPGEQDCADRVWSLALATKLGRDLTANEWLSHYRERQG